MLDASKRVDEIEQLLDAIRQELLQRDYHVGVMVYSREAENFQEMYSKKPADGAIIIHLDNSNRLALYEALKDDIEAETLQTDIAKEAAEKFTYLDTCKSPEEIFEDRKKLVPSSEDK